MRDDLKRNFEYCNKCETYYIDVIGETCRCPAPMGEDEVNEELLSERHSVKLRLQVSKSIRNRV